MSAYAIVILILVLFYTFYMGFNDGSTAIATTIVSRAIKPQTAILVAAAVQFVTPILFFLLGSMSVAGNINSALFFGSIFEGITPEKGFAFLLSGMLGAIIWSGIAFAAKIPNTISHTLLGGLLGAGVAAFGLLSVQWKEYVILNVVAMVALAPIIGLILGYLLMKLFKKLARHAPRGISMLLNITQRLNLVILTGAFSSNNAQKAIGVVLLLGTLGLSGYTASTMPIWLVICVSAALTLGMLSGSFRVINTVGRKIFKVGPMHSVVSQMTTTVVSIVGTGLGISLGMGQVMTSAVMGVGAADRIKAVHWTTAGKIALGWCCTLPISAGAGALMYLLIGKLIMGV